MVKKAKNMLHPLIIVLGGGPPVAQSPITPPLYVVERCVAAHEQYIRFLSEGSSPKILCLSSGTAHIPSALTSSGHPLHESVASASYFSSVLGVPASDLLVETVSYDTVGNAFFARVQHLAFGPPSPSPRPVVVVTSDFHMPRSRLIFDKVLSLPHRLGAGDAAQAWAASYIATSNGGLSEAEVEARCERESKSLRAIAEKFEDIHDMQDLYNFVNFSHDFYSAKGLVKAADPPPLSSAALAASSLNQDLLKSYGGANNTK
jgi:hypothetical protein